jgi:hypothetical protein
VSHPLHTFGLAAGVTLTLAVPAWSQDVSAWNAERANLFSRVCMATAPTFAGLSRALGEQGFHDMQGQLVHEPEVVVSLTTDGQTCTCYMTMGAPEPNSLTMTVFQQLLTDFPNAWAPQNAQGAVNDTSFVRDGVPVRLLLSPAEIDGAYWLAARVIVPGACS